MNGPEDMPDELTDAQLDALLETTGTDLLRYLEATSDSGTLLSALLAAEQTTSEAPAAFYDDPPAWHAQAAIAIRALARDLDLVRALDLDLDLAHTLARPLAHTLDLALYRAHARALDHALDLYRVLDAHGLLPNLDGDRWARAWDHLREFAEGQVDASGADLR